MRTLFRVVIVVGLLGMFAAMPAPAGRPAALSHLPAAEHTARTASAALPLAFERNDGQADAAVRFIAHSAGFSLALTADAVILALGGEGMYPPATVRFTFPGANPFPALATEKPLPGVANYFIGNAPTSWRTNVPTSAQVRYHGLYPGIDLTVYGTARHGWEYDAIIAPGADPATFALRIDGATGTSLDAATGDLVLATAVGAVRERAPVIYQESAGVRVPVEGGFDVRRDGTVGFRVGAYDPSLPLVIDPSLAYSTYVGGSGNDFGNGIAVDSAGNAYITGVTNGAFPTTVGAFQTTQITPGPFRHAFVTKLNASGTAALYSTYLGGSGNDVGQGIAVDGAGSAYVTGSTGSTDFPTTVSAFQTTPGGGGFSDAFVTKLNPAGSGLVYSTYLGGNKGDSSNAIAVDGPGNAYVTGSTLSANFPTTPGVFQTTYVGADAFVTKLNTTGSALVYSTYIGSSGSEEGNGIAVDGAGNAYITGDSTSSFPTTVGAFQTSKFVGNAFVTKLNPAGTTLVYSTYLSGSGNDAGRSIAVDTGGEALVTGNVGTSVLGSGFPTTPGAYQTAYGGNNNDVFVAKLNSAGSGLVYGTYLGGAGDDQGYGIAVDGAGNAFVTGYTTGSFPTTAGAYQTTFGAGGQDAFVTKLNAAGTALLYSTYLGGNNLEQGSGIAVNGASDIYVTGYSRGSFPTTAGAYQTVFGGVDDAFVARFTIAPPAPNPLPPSQPPGSPGGSPAPLPALRPGGSGSGSPAPLPNPRP